MRGLLIPLTPWTEPEETIYVATVPEFEERETAAFVQVSWTDWCSMDWREKAAGIAHYRAHNLIEANVNHAIGRYMDEQSRKASRR